MLENGGPASDSPIRALSYATEVRSGVSPLILIFENIDECFFSFLFLTPYLPATYTFKCNTLFST